MGAEISKLSVLITGNASGLVSGLKQSEGAVSSFKGKVEGMSLGLGGLGGILGTFAAGFGIAEVFKDFAEGEDAAAKLESVLTATGGAAGRSSEQIRELANNLQDTTKFSDDAALSASALLATFTNVRGDQFDEALKTAADLATVMGTDLSAAATTVGRALNNPANAAKILKRAHVELTEAQQEQIAAFTAAGDVVSAQGVILDALRGKVGGAADAVGNTFGGQIARASHAAADLAKQLASYLAPAVGVIASGIQIAAKWTSEHAEGLRLAMTFMAATGAAVITYKTALLTLSIAQKAAAAGQAILLAMEGPIGWAMLAAGAAAAGLAVWGVSEAYDAIGRKAIESGKITESEADRAKMVVDGIGDSADEAGDSVGSLGSKIKSAADEAAKLAETYRATAQTAGMSTREAELYKLQLAGATAEQMKQAEAWSHIANAQEAAVKTMEQLNQSARKWADAILDPFEKLELALEEIGRAEEANLLTERQAEAAREKAAEDATKATKFRKELDAATPKSFGSERLEAFSTRFTQGFTAEQSSTWEKMREANEKTAKNAEAIRKAVEKMDLRGKVVAIGD